MLRSDYVNINWSVQDNIMSDFTQNNTCVVFPVRPHIASLVVLSQDRTRAASNIANFFTHLVETFLELKILSAAERPQLGQKFDFIDEDSNYLALCVKASLINAEFRNSPFNFCLEL